MNWSWIDQAGKRLFARLIVRLFARLIVLKPIICHQWSSYNMTVAHLFVRGHRGHTSTRSISWSKATVSYSPSRNLPVTAWDQG